MSFSARQLHCMLAMGLVAWTQRLDPVSAPLVSSGKAAAAFPTPEDSGTVSDGPAGIADHANAAVFNATAMPFDIDALAEWLVEQALVPFNHRGTSVSFSGSELASLLLVCVHTDVNSQDAASIQPLNAECMQLLKLMLRAIDLSMTDIRQCIITVVDSVRSVSNYDGLPETIDGLCTPHNKGVLLLDPLYSEHIHQSGSDACLIPTSSLPLWRIPHPDCLLQDPALKRHAWESLKAVKRALADHRQRA